MIEGSAAGTFPFGEEVVPSLVHIHSWTVLTWTRSFLGRVVSWPKASFLTFLESNTGSTTMSWVEVVSFLVDATLEIISSWSRTIIGRSQEAVLITCTWSYGERPTFLAYNGAQFVWPWSRYVLLVSLRWVFLEVNFCIGFTSDTKTVSFCSRVSLEIGFCVVGVGRRYTIPNCEVFTTSIPEGSATAA